jgi:hypothetical protein
MTKLKFTGENAADVLNFTGHKVKIKTDASGIFFSVSTPVGVRELRPNDSIVLGDSGLFWVEKEIKHEPLRRGVKSDTTVRCSASSNKGRAVW